MSRGYRNNNPGNIRKSGTVFRGEVRPSGDKAFKTFKGMEWGYRAMFRILKTYYCKYGLRTLGKMIARWAPESENDTAGYVRFVSSRTGFSPDTEIPFSEGAMCIIVYAMSMMENGTREKPDMRAIRRGWELL